MGKTAFKKRQASQKKARIKFNLHMTQSRRQYEYEKEDKILESIFENCLTEIWVEIVRAEIIEVKSGEVEKTRVAGENLDISSLIAKYQMKSCQVEEQKKDKRKKKEKKDGKSLDIFGFSSSKAISKGNRDFSPKIKFSKVAERQKYRESCRKPFVTGEVRNSYKIQEMGAFMNVKRCFVRLERVSLRGNSSEG